MENNTEKNFDTSTTGASNTIDIKTEIDVDDYQYQLKQEPSEEDILAKKRRLTGECQQTFIPKLVPIRGSNAGSKEGLKINDKRSANLPVLQTILIQQPVMQTVVLPSAGPSIIYVSQEDFNKILGNNKLQQLKLNNANFNSTIVSTNNDKKKQDLAGQYVTLKPKSLLEQPLTPTVVQQFKGQQIFQQAYDEFKNKFTNNTFGHTCRVCDRLWFKDDVRLALPAHRAVLLSIGIDISTKIRTMLCSTCIVAIEQNKIPTMAAFNGFRYPRKPPQLPELDLVSERLVSPIIPFIQIRRLIREHEQYDIYGQVINIPAARSNMVQKLPRDLDDDLCFYVHLKNKVIYKSSSLRVLINKHSIRLWLEYLVRMPLYERYRIKIKQEFFQDDEDVKIVFDDVTEEIPIDECPTARHSTSTLLWNEDNFLRCATSKRKVPHNLLFEDFAEEFYFPLIYIGRLRRFNEGVNASTAMIVASELTRTDRRGVTPCHLLYVAMKMIRQRVDNCLAVATKFVGPDNNLTRQQLQSKDFMNSWIQCNLAIPKCIPNSDWFWADKKRDLFAILRQRGKPTTFMTLTANEIGWPGLLQVLYKLKNHGALITEEAVKNMPLIKKCTLINDDAPTCAIYFSKLIHVILKILQLDKCSPFGKFRVKDYFTRVEFHRGSPRVHILMWLKDVPKDFFGGNYVGAIKWIDIFSSVSPSKALDHVELQTHKHSSTCYENIAPNARRKCKFGAPFMPCKTTLIVSPLDPPRNDASKQFFETCRSNYLKIKNNLENIDYTSFEDFYKKNSIESDLHYINILRAGIDRVTIFLKREPCEKWIQPFNPFILSVLGSHMDFQFITDDISCAECVAKCVSKINRGVSDLREKILETMKEHPEFDIAQITRKLSVDMLNSVEMTTQEAAWYLLREPMSESSIRIVYLPTIPPNERQKIKNDQLSSFETDKDSTNPGEDNYFIQYVQRPEDLEDLTLAEFHSMYFKNTRGNFEKRLEPLVIRYRNYDVDTDTDEYKREMVTLHIPFRNEERDIIANKRFLYIYDDNEDIIVNRRRDFEYDFDTAKTLETCDKLYQQNDKPVINKNEVKVTKNNKKRKKT